MIVAAGYILLVPENRRKSLTSALIVRGGTSSIGEPVPSFEHSRRAPLVVLAAFEDEAITHVASGRKGAPGSGGTGMIRLNMREMQSLAKPIPFADLVTKVPQRLKPHLNRVLNHGGLLPPKTLVATIDALLAIAPDLTGRLARFSERRTEMMRRFTPKESENLGAQKETLSVSLRIAGMDTDEVLACWHGRRRP